MQEQKENVIKLLNSLTSLKMSTKENNLDNLPEVKNQFLNFLKNNPDNFYCRNNPNGHITSSCFVLDETHTQTLLVHHKKFDIWLQPGGHWDKIDESIYNSALREVFEECFDNKEVEFKDLNKSTPFDIDIHAATNHTHFDIAFLIEIKKNNQIISNPIESHDVSWFNIEEVIKNENSFDQRVVRMCKKINKNKFNLKLQSLNNQKVNKTF